MDSTTPTYGKLTAVVVRADGTRSNLGTICYTGGNRLVRAYWKVWGSKAAARRVRKANRSVR